jgi:DNA adenine methylase
MRPATKTHGGKSYLSRRIVPLLPPHTIYVEPFFGGGSVLLRKPRSEVEIAGDLNPALIGFYKCLQNQTQELIERARSIPYTPESFAWACETDDLNLGPVESAARFIVKACMSRGGLGRSFAWSERLRGGQPGDKNAWDTFLQELPRISHRLERVEIYHSDAPDLIQQFDSPDTLHYCDPPYPWSVRAARKAYGPNEMSDDEHARLLDVITKAHGMVAGSGRPCPLYDDALQGWKRHDREVVNHAGQGKRKQRRIESLWLSPTCDVFRLT